LFKLQEGGTVVFAPSQKTAVVISCILLRFWTKRNFVLSGARQGSFATLSPAIWARLEQLCFVRFIHIRD